MEGRIERPITKKTIVGLGLFLTLLLSVFLWRAGELSLANGEKYLNISKEISIDKETIFADRGVIYDRNNVLLAWNEAEKNATSSNEFELRNYINKPGFSHILGYVGYPKKDTAGNYWQKKYIGRDGIEKIYNDHLAGINGNKLIEINALGNTQSENMVYPAISGENLTLSLDARLQEKLFDVIKNLSATADFRGGSGVIMDVNTGEIIALASYPEYDAKKIMESDNEAIKAFNSDVRKPYLNRAVSGLYTPGSIVKPYLAIGALSEGVISPTKKILSTGSISLPNPYFPELRSVFKDWKAHGWVDMREALAVSSDVYFYEVGGGFEEQKGIGINNIEKYMRMFGLGEKTGVDIVGEVDGVIPNPEWKAENFNGDIWRIGNTYHTAIGQYGFQVTPIQVARAVSAIANNGKLFRPTVLFQATSTKVLPERTIDIKQEYCKVVQEGMRRAVTIGTAGKLNVPFVEVAGKTGSAQLGVKKKFLNSWITGYFPYDNPEYAFAVVMERGPAQTPYSASSVMQELFWWMNDNTPEYFE